MSAINLLGLLLQEIGEGGGILAMMGAGFILFAIVIYAFAAICLMKIAEKTNTENAWWAWIPILNVLLMIAIPRKPMRWIILFLVPLVNLVIAALVFMGISEMRGKSPLLGLLMLLPGLNLIILAYLAFSD